MREHGVSLETMENIEKIENINQSLKTLFMIQKTLFVTTQNTLFVNQITENTAVKKIIT